MSAVGLDAMNNAAAWTALEEDGVTPSTDLTIQDDPTLAGSGADGVSARVVASPAADGHRLQRTIAAVDVSELTEIRLSLLGDRPAAGDDDDPFFLELRLGSAALPLGSATNTWHRLLPLRSPQRWQTVKVGIDDLDAPIAGALTQLELRCVDAPFTANVDDLIAVRPEMIADADRGFEARLAGITIGGSPAPALVRSPAEAAPASPALDLVHVDLRFAATRVRDVTEVRDHTEDGGLRVVRAPSPYDLYYSVTAVADTRAEQAALFEAVADRLAPFDELLVDGERLPVDLVWVDGPNRPSGAPGLEPVLFYRVGTRQWQPTPPQVVSAVEELVLETDYGASAP